MPAPQERDLNKATEDFKNWLINEKDQDASIMVEVLGGPENTGFSNETLSFNVTQGCRNHWLCSALSSIRIFGIS